MIRTNQEQKEEWNKNAALYAEGEKLSLTGAISMTNPLPFKEGVTILEVGWGTGALSCHLLQNLNIKCTIISLDISEEMINLANKRKCTVTYDQSLITHEFKVGNAEDLKSIQDESVDIYISSMVIHLVTDDVKMLQEAFRVLKKGR